MPKLENGKISRRSVLAGLAAAGAASGLPSAPAIAQQQWPKGRTIKVVVPFAPGGATDVLARITGDKLSQIWGTPVVIENKPGAGANIGMEYVARAEPNGDTIMMGTIGLAINPSLYKALKFDPLKDFAPISMITIMPNLVTAPASASYSTIPELIAYAKANPGKMNYGTSGIGTSVHLSGALFNKLAGIDMTPVHYRGSGPALQDLIAGRTHVMFDNMAACLPLVQGGKLKGLAVTTLNRSKFLPNLPVVADTLPGFDVSPWFGLLAPAKTPSEIVDRIYRDTKTALQDENIKKRLDSLAADNVGSTPAEFAARIREDSDRWSKVIREANISAG